jgi:hypothetical protein
MVAEARNAPPCSAPKPGDVDTRGFLDTKPALG